MKTPPKKIRTGKFINCIFCQTPFYIKKYQFLIAKYCSRSCQAKATNVKISTRCGVCKKEFTHISSRCNRAKYCSNKCRYQAHKNKGLTEYECHHCHKKFMDSKSCKRKYCSKQCVNKESKKTWKAVFSTVRKNMIARGMIKRCENCGYDKEIKILGVHHKDENRNNNHPSNLAVLCPTCHSLAHMKHISHKSTR